MSTIKRMTLEEARAYKPSAEEVKRMKEFVNTDFSDCPALTPEELKLFKRVGTIYKPTKRHVTLRLDSDILAIFKAEGKGYQTRINEALREYISEHPEMIRT